MLFLFRCLSRLAFSLEGRRVHPAHESRGQSRRGCPHRSQAGWKGNNNDLKNRPCASCCWHSREFAESPAYLVKHGSGRCQDAGDLGHPSSGSRASSSRQRAARPGVRAFPTFWEMRGARPDLAPLPSSSPFLRLPAVMWWPPPAPRPAPPTHATGAHTNFT